MRFKPLDLYRMLAAELGLRPGPRAQIVSDIKRALVTLVERGVVPILVLDDAQALRDDVLHELHGLTCLDFDAREYLALFGAMLDHALAAAAAPPDLVTPDTRELLLRVSRGIPRLVSHLLCIALILADERGHGPIDVSIINTATVLLHLDPPTPAVMPPIKARADRGPRSRG